MLRLKKIKKENIRKEVMSHVRHAQKEILATLHITEEKNSPLPIEYFSLLKKKVKEGVKIKRVIFGTASEYKSFIKDMKSKKIFFTGRRTRSKDYKRMILIDKTQLFLLKDNKGIKNYYFTSDIKYIKQFNRYFNKISLYK